MFSLEALAALLFRGVFISVGASMSPAWGIFFQALKPYINFGLMTQDQAAFISEVLRFETMLSHRPEVANNLIGPLFIALVIHLAIIVTCGILGHLAFQRVWQLQARRKVLKAS